MGSICSNSLCEANPKWQCLGDSEANQASTDSVHLGTRVVSMATKQPIPGISVTLCAKLDVTCLAPVDRFVSAASGELDIVMRAGFDGYLLAEGEGLSPTMFFFPLMYESRNFGALPMTSPAFSAVLYQQLGATFNDQRGVITFSVVDCAREPAPGVVLTNSRADSDTVPFYLVNGLPTSDIKMTDSAGVGGFVNVPLGTVLLTATLEAAHKTLDPVSVVTRPGFVSMTLIDPTAH